MAPGLYPRLLGDGWGRLHETVRRLHADGTAVRATGSFRITHGRGPLAACLKWLFRLPASGDAVPTTLAIDVREEGETWRRTFGDRPLTTEQSLHRDSLLAERFGALELRFRLHAEAGALTYHQTGAALLLGPLACPLPRWLQPRVEGREEPGAFRDESHVTVRVSVPLVGLLLSYEGAIRCPLKDGA